MAYFSTLDYFRNRKGQKPLYIISILIYVTTNVLLTVVLANYRALIILYTV
jgi:hypothetical protein